MAEVLVCDLCAKKLRYFGDNVRLKWKAYQGPRHHRKMWGTWWRIDVCEQCVTALTQAPRLEEPR